MKTLERIEAALTPGSMFNEKGHVWRSVDAVRIFSGLDDEEEVLSLLNGGDLNRVVTYKISKKNQKLMVAFQDQLDDEDEEEPVKVSAPTIEISIPSDIGLEKAVKLAVAAADIEAAGSNDHGVLKALGGKVTIEPAELAEVFPNPCKEVEPGVPLDKATAPDDPEDDGCKAETCPVDCVECGTEPEDGGEYGRCRLVARHRAGVAQLDESS